MIMQSWISKNLPTEELKRLDFLVGEYSSWQTMWPAGDQPPVRYRSVVRAYREGCDRFLRMEQFADVPGVGLVSSTALYTFNRKEAAYESYGFSSAHEEALRFRGYWDRNSLILTSTPVAGYGGLDRFRHTIVQRGEDSWDFLEERWDLDGFVKHAQGTYLACAG
jgi:hypothetical protein